MMAKVLPKYIDEGIALFRRVLGARSAPTGLTLSFCQWSSDSAIACKSERITESMEHFWVDEIRRRLNSRCGGLLEFGSNPALGIMRTSEEHESVWNNIPWTRRPHIAIAPVVSFLHRTVIEYLQRSLL
jgi:hypothetical protein